MPDGALPSDALLEVTESDGRRRMVPITENPFNIGRGSEMGNHLQLADTRISRSSAAVIYESGGFLLKDRGQRHGIKVNGEEITGQRPLRDGDVIVLGTAEGIQLTFRSGQQARESLPKLLSKLEEAQSLEGETKDIRKLSLLLEATAMLQSHLPVEVVLASMVDRAIDVTNGERGLLFEVDEKGGLRPMLARQKGAVSVPPESITPSQTAISQALQKKRSVVEEDLGQSGSALREAKSVVAQNLRSMAAIPLVSLRQMGSADSTMLAMPVEVLGVLYLDSRKPATFSRLERQILDALAREAASVLDNARLVLRERDRQRMEQELSIARDIQQALLPKGFKHLSYTRVGGVNRPCLEVGGDYFDLMELGPERTAFVIADVSGKGLGAALVMAMLQGNFSAMALGSEPAAVCAHVNRFICNRSGVQRYATLFFGILEASGKLDYINAGHPPPILIRNGSVSPALPASCLPLGLLPDAEFKDTTFQMQPGDTLIFYTDGITEAVNKQNEQFGVERLQEVVARHVHASIDKLQEAILAAVAEFSHGCYQADDITALIISYVGSPEPARV
ncbi:MAG TPA: SpoIIE family protein phosphatase [Candidatus Xenobia bacterium]|nr:SpoIIE family protein phosphatase [Candidatus Xenobia bacterium]